MNIQQTAHKILQRVIILIILLMPTFAFSQGWEHFGTLNPTSTIPSAIIETAQQNYITVGTSIAPPSGLVLTVERFDQEGKRVASTNLDVINSVTANKEGYTISELASERSYLITGAEIGYIKISNQSDLIWQKDVADLGLAMTDSIVWSTKTNDGNAFILTQGVDATSNNTFARLLKISPSGLLMWNQPYNLNYNLYPNSHIATSDNGAIIMGMYDDGGESGTFLIKTNSNGNQLWVEKYPGIVGERKTLVEDSDENILFNDGNNNLNSFRKHSAEGTLLWQEAIATDLMHSVTSVNVDQNGNYLLTGNRTEIIIPTNSIEGPRPTWIKLDTDGNELWNREHQVPNGATVLSTTVASDNSSVSIGQITNSFDFGDFRIKVDGEGDVYQNFIEGNVFVENDTNCINNGDPALENWVVKAAGPVTLYGLTDEEGFYRIPVFPGSYDVSASSVSIYYQACEETITVEATAGPNTSTADFAMKPIIDCVYNQVEISVPFLRFCNDQTYTVDYCNYGTIANESIIIEVYIDEALTFNSSTIPVTSQDGSTYTFEIDEELGVGECGKFYINTTLTCEEELIGTTVCVEANVLPNDICIPDYDGPLYEIEGYCEGDSVVFEVTNVGLSTGTDVNYIVIEDNIVLLVEDSISSILTSETIDIKVKAEQNKTYNMQVFQEAAMPPPLGDPTASQVVESCVGFPTQPTVYQNYGDDDGEVWESEDCQEIISSLDPNDKQVVPNGIMEEHYTLANLSMEYKIRFQNTGTDTAFLVVIRDTLSEHLDLESFTPGTSSHPYTYEILERGYLKFTFENVLLPDSTTNEPASHGFVKFTIRQQPDLAVGTVIENCAGIYFDFNSVVLTNCVFNTIGDLETVGFVVSNEAIPTEHTKEVKVYPNPFSEFVNFEIVDEERSVQRQFSLYNSVGQLVKTETFDDNNYQFHKQLLPSGIYYYDLKENNNIINSGKLIIQ